MTGQRSPAHDKVWNATVALAFPGREHGAPVHEKRSHARAPLNVEVICELSDGTRVQGTSRDISLGGMYVETSAQVPFNTQLIVVVRLPGAREDSRLPGVIRWSTPDGFGIQFGLLGARETHHITELMRK